MTPAVYSSTIAHAAGSAIDSKVRSEGDCGVQTGQVGRAICW